MSDHAKTQRRDSASNVEQCVRLLEAHCRETAGYSDFGSLQDLIPVLRHEGVRQIAFQLCDRLLELGGEVQGLQGYQSELVTSLRLCTAPNRAFFNATLGVAILQVLERIGDADVLPVVIALCGNPEPTRPVQRIGFAAIKARDAILERAKTEHDRTRLLRPVEVPPDSETLLRPAGIGASEDIERLVRPVEMPGDSGR